MDAKIFVPLVPSLLHLTVVKEAINLYNDFHIEELDEAYRRIRVGISVTSEDCGSYPDFMGCNRAQKKFLLIPPRLRKRVMEAIHGLKSGVGLWKKEHKLILGLDNGECIFYWNFDGTIDTVKTAQKLVLNSNIDIRARFYLSCMYCLAGSIQTLWAEMEATGKTENLETDIYLVVRFWVRWLRDGSRVPWKQAALEYLEISYPGMRFSSFFTSLLPEEREIFLNCLIISTYDDLRLCLYAMTRAEEEIILRRCPHRVLVSYLHWPLRSLFLEKAGKIFKYIDEISYRNILKNLLSKHINREIFDFYDFFECFWNSSPKRLREIAKESPYLREKIESCFNESRRKRKADFDELRNQKMKK